MQKFPTILGYAGAAPFIVLTLAMYAVGDVALHSSLALCLMAYAAMIASFLAGVHWPVAMHQKDKTYLMLSMMPSIFGFFFVLGIVFLGQIVGFLVIMAGVFWMLYLMDKKYLPEDGFAKGYFDFRRNLTIIVSGALLISALRFFL